MRFPSSKRKARLQLVNTESYFRIAAKFFAIDNSDNGRRKEKYLKMIPFIWDLTERNLNNPIFRDYKDWLDAYIPSEFRTKNLKTEDFNAQ